MDRKCFFGAAVMARPRLIEQQDPSKRSLYTTYEAAELIGVSEPTLRSYKRLGWFHILDFRAVNFVNGQIQKRQPLTSYQVWVLGKIAELHSKIPNGSSAAKLRSWLKNNGNKFMSYEAYQYEISKGLQTA